MTGFELAESTPFGSLAQHRSRQKDEYDTFDSEPFETDTDDQMWGSPWDIYFGQKKRSHHYKSWRDLMAKEEQYDLRHFGYHSLYDLA